MASYCCLSIFINSALPTNRRVHSTCMPSPSPKFTVFCSMITVHKFRSSFRKNEASFGNFPLKLFFKWPTTWWFFQTSTANLSTRSSGSLLASRISPTAGIHRSWYAWWPLIVKWKRGSRGIRRFDWSRWWSSTSTEFFANDSCCRHH